MLGNFHISRILNYTLCVDLQRRSFTNMKLPKERKKWQHQFSKIEVAGCLILIAFLVSGYPKCLNAPSRLRDFLAIETNLRTLKLNPTPSQYYQSLIYTLYNPHLRNTSSHISSPHCRTSQHLPRSPPNGTEATIPISQKGACKRAHKPAGCELG